MFFKMNVSVPAQCRLSAEVKPVTGRNSYMGTQHHIGCFAAMAGWTGLGFEESDVPLTYDKGLSESILAHFAQKRKSLDGIVAKFDISTIYSSDYSIIHAIYCAEQPFCSSPFLPFD